ncbi:sensor histidine kinase [Primorskyibacter sp. S187A]|uniref:sensor histidine kinase n=1 Tax=Primorskyibacter sp. S187A TaxID=3415130 RepID=UPI003C79E02D
MKGSAERQTYDLEAYRDIVRNHVAEMLFRVVGLNAAGLIATYLFQDRVFLYFLGAYNLSQLAFLLILRALPDRVSLRQLAVLFGIGWFCVIVILSSSAYVWVTQGAAGKVLGLLLIVTVMLYSTAQSTYHAIFTRVEVGLTSLCLLGLAVHTALMEDMTGPAVSMVLGLVAVLAYYLQAAFGTRRAHEQLQINQALQVERARVEAIGQITGGVAHDFNNLLTIIQGNLELRREIQQQGGSLIEAEQLIREAEEATHRAARTTQQLLAYSRKSVLRPEVVLIEDVIGNMDRLLHSTLPATIDLRINMPSGLPPIRCDVSQLENVILNLVINARDAMPEGGRVLLRARERACPRRPLERTCLQIQVEDNGAGIPEEILGKVTDPFFTTKPVGKGSGLGLSMAKGVMEQSGGLLEISSIKGRGTIVTLSFPSVVLEAQPRETVPGQL